MKPVIGILGDTSDIIMENKDRAENVCIAEDYVRSVELAGGVPIVIPPLGDHENIERLMSICDALLFTGGRDINPMMYGQDPHTSLSSYSTKLDEFQIEILKKGISIDMPILAICRGHQLLNIAKGGTLYQDPKDYGKNIMQHLQMSKRGEVAHKVRFSKESKLHSIFGDEYYVNSYHHQFINQLGEGLKIVAQTRDGVIEAVEMEEKSFVIGVQWHPEIIAPIEETTLNLFKTLVDKAR